MFQYFHNFIVSYYCKEKPNLFFVWIEPSRKILLTSLSLLMKFETTWELSFRDFDYIRFKYVLCILYKPLNKAIKDYKKVNEEKKLSRDTTTLIMLFQIKFS